MMHPPPYEHVGSATLKRTRFQLMCTLALLRAKYAYYSQVTKPVLYVNIILIFRIHIGWVCDWVGLGVDRTACNRRLTRNLRVLADLLSERVWQIFHIKILADFFTQKEGDLHQ